ncbi:MAG: hypothetical protein ACOYMF_05370 [Bacteroidales bacterium]
MKSNSDIQPKAFLYLGVGKYHVNFGVEQVTVPNPDLSTRQAFSYDSVEVYGEPVNAAGDAKPEYDVIIAGIIADRYSIADELALINNFLADDSVDEYQAYQKWRRVAKHIANSATLTTKAELLNID